MKKHWILSGGQTPPIQFNKEWRMKYGSVDFSGFLPHTTRKSWIWSLNCASKYEREPKQQKKSTNRKKHAHRSNITIQLRQKTLSCLLAVFKSRLNNGPFYGGCESSYLLAFSHRHSEHKHTCVWAHRQMLAAHALSHIRVTAACSCIHWSMNVVFI